MNHKAIPPIVYLKLDLSKKQAPIGHPHNTTPPPYIQKHRPARVAFVSSVCLYMVVAMLCLVFPFEANETGGGVRIPDTALCFRCGRYADYATVDVSIGTPRNQMSLLLRLDSRLDEGSSEQEFVFFDQETVESSTISCDADGVCEDAVLVSSGPRGDFKKASLTMQYVSAAVASASGMISARISGVHGEFRLRAGMQYWLTATHFCFASKPSNSTPTLFAEASDLEATVTSDGEIEVHRSWVSANTVLDGNVASVSAALCQSSEFALFPQEASVETSWLSIVDTRIYNSEPVSVERRREIAELGVDCTRRIGNLNRSLSLYLLDCTPYGSCRTGLAVPFRRAATCSLFVDAESHPSNNVTVSLKHESSLENLPRLANSEEAFLLSIAKLFLISLSAAIVYVRSKRPTASSSWLVKHCIRSASTDGPKRVKFEEQEDEKQQQQPEQPEQPGKAYSVLEDAVIGVLAFTARILVVLYKFEQLVADSQRRLAIVEVSAGVLSFVHWTARYIVDKDDKDSPVSKLGGSTAIIDSTSAVMLAFSDAPILVVSSGRFAPTARMLVAVLVSVTAIWRIAFSATCCAILFEAQALDPKRRGQSILLLFSCALWVLQAGALGVLISDAFVTPSVFSMTRTFTGETTTARLLLFTAILSMGLPRLNETSANIRSKRARVD